MPRATFRATLDRRVATPVSGGCSCIGADHGPTRRGVNNFFWSSPMEPRDRRRSGPASSVHSPSVRRPFAEPVHVQVQAQTTRPRHAELIGPRRWRTPRWISDPAASPASRASATTRAAASPRGTAAAATATACWSSPARPPCSARSPARASCKHIWMTMMSLARGAARAAPDRAAHVLGRRRAAERRGAARRLLRHRLRAAAQLHVAAAADEPAGRARLQLLVSDAVRRRRALRGREPGQPAALLLLLRRLRGAPPP